jgi:hypothetical protein
MALPDIADSLLVPMNVQAAVVNDAVLAGVAFTDGAYNYENLATYLSPAPAPFDTSGDPLAKGVHLQWELPAAFRNGTQPDQSAQPEYPLVPNRWLILRYWPGQDTARRQFKAWVVQADYLGADGSNSYVQPSGPNQGQPTRLGKVVALGDFSEPGTPLHLQAVSPGNTSFSAFRPNVKDVFAFTDDVTDNAGNPLLTGPNQTVHLSYVVLGWFSDPAHDPLHGVSTAAAWAQKMGALQWITTPFPFALAGASPPQQAFGLTGYGDVSAQFPKGQSLTITGSTGNDGSYAIAGDPVYDPTYDHLTLPVDRAMPSALADGYMLPPGAPAVWPTTTLVHGLLYDLAWQNDTVPARPNASPQDVARTVRLAAGNSSTDALAALIAAEASEEGASPAQALAEALALEAFQTGMLGTLDQPDGTAQLDLKLRAQAFGEDDGGIAWSLVANTDVDGQAKADAAQQAWLAEIAYYQQGHDREARILKTMQQRLYMDWWRVRRITTGYTPPNLGAIWSRIQGEITGALPDAAAAVAAQQDNVVAWQARIAALIAAPPSQDSSGTTIGIQTPGWSGQPQALELKPSKMPRFYRPNDPVLLISGLGASARSGPDQNGEEVAPCRLGADHISALDVADVTVPLDGVAALTTPPGGTALPAGVLAAATVLGAEAVLLDPDNAALIATATTAAAADIAGAIRAGDYAGQAPASWAAMPWLQAWQPLYMEWQVSWYPTVAAPVIQAGNGPQWGFDRANWRFDGLDYGWTGGDVSNPFTGPAATGQAVTAANASASTITLGGAGDLSFAYTVGAKFTVSGGAALNGSYTVASFAAQGEDFVVTTVEAVPSGSAAGGTATLQLLSGGQVSVSGRTFLTPQATFNVRNRLEQYIRTQKQAGKDDPALDQAAHLLDIIGGARYDIVSASATAKSITIGTPVDLAAVFAAGSICYVAEAKANVGSFTVVSTSFDQTDGSFTVVVAEAVADSGPDGLLVPEPTEWDILSQSLSGMTDLLIMRSLEPNAMAQGAVGQGSAAAQTYDALVGDVSQDVPQLTLGDSISAAGGTPTPYFFPIRGGFAALRQLQLVDRFGQKVNLLYANGNGQFSDPANLWQTFAPLRSSWLTPATDTKLADPQRLLRLPPRVSSPIRLDFPLVAAPDTADGSDRVDIDLIAGANPVCGWVLPNHLDQGLLIYDRDGGSLGELSLSHRANGVLEVVWFPTPEATTPITDPTDPTTGIPNHYMRGFIAGILNQPAATRGQAFANLLQAIDSTLWAVDPLGGRTDQSLSVLVGRPLGLVRARLKLTADGEVPQDESTQYVVPMVVPIGAGSADSLTLNAGGSMSYYASLGLFARGTTLAISGSGGADGRYTIAAAGYDAGTVTLTLIEPLPAQTDGGNAVLHAPTGMLTTTPFDVRLGRADLFDDGLIGFFRDADFSALNVTHLPTGLPDAGYLQPIGTGNYLSATIWSERSATPPVATPVPIPDPASQFVTMLVDPRAGVHATTGILPSQTLTLPPIFYEQPLAQMEISFQAGPIIVDAEAIRLPRPSEQSGTWSWVQKNATGDAAAAWDQDPISPTADQARIPRMPQDLRDGWMKLTAHDFTSD